MLPGEDLMEDNTKCPHVDLGGVGVVLAGALTHLRRDVRKGAELGCEAIFFVGPFGVVKVADFDADGEEGGDEDVLPAVRRIVGKGKGGTDRWLDVAVGDPHGCQFRENSENLLHNIAGPGFVLRGRAEEPVAEVAVLVVFHRDIRVVVLEVLVPAEHAHDCESLGNLAHSTSAGILM